MNVQIVERYKIKSVPPSYAPQSPEVTTVDSLFLVLLEVDFMTLKVILLFSDISTLDSIN